MGQDKAGLEVMPGRSLLRHIVELAARECELVVVSASAGQALPDLPQGVLRVDDPPARAGGGPLVGIGEGLRVLNEQGAKWAYLGACDTPWLHPEHLRFMFARLEGEAAPTACVAGDEKGRLHPLAAVLAVDKGARRAQRMLEGGERRLSDLFRGLEGVEILPHAAFPRPEVFRDCDTPEEWRAFLDDASGLYRPDPQ